jgi:hypothetical protein
VRAAEFQCDAIQPIQMPTPSQMTARTSTANTIRQMPISSRIFTCFMAPTTVRRAARAEDFLLGQALRAGYALPLDLMIGAR